MVSKISNSVLLFRSDVVYISTINSARRQRPGAPSNFVAIYCRAAILVQFLAPGNFLPYAPLPPLLPLLANTVVEALGRLCQNDASAAASLVVESSVLRLYIGSLSSSILGFVPRVYHIPLTSLSAKIKVPCVCVCVCWLNYTHFLTNKHANTHTHRFSIDTRKPPAMAVPSEFPEEFAKTARTAENAIFCGPSKRKDFAARRFAALYVCSCLWQSVDIVLYLCSPV